MPKRTYVCEFEVPSAEGTLWVYGGIAMLLEGGKAWCRRVATEGADPGDGIRRPVLAARLTDDRKVRRHHEPATDAQRDAAWAAHAAKIGGTPVCPRCLGIEPGKPGRAPTGGHPGPFTQDLCGHCITAA